MIVKSESKSNMSSFKSNENIHKKEDGSYYVVSANKASSVTLQPAYIDFSQTGWIEVHILVHMYWLTVYCGF